MTVRCVFIVNEQNLKKLNRSDLLEILLTQSRKIDELNLEIQQLQQQLQETKQQLESRHIDLVEAGSIAEAAVRLNGVFEAAQAACDQYMENIKCHTGEQEMHYPEPVQK